MGLSTHPKWEAPPFILFEQQLLDVFGYGGHLQNSSASPILPCAIGFSVALPNSSAEELVGSCASRAVAMLVSVVRIHACLALSLSDERWEEDQIEIKDVCKKIRAYSMCMFMHLLLLFQSGSFLQV